MSITTLFSVVLLMFLVACGNSEQNTDKLETLPEIKPEIFL